MKRKIIVEIETDESGRYCGECEHADFGNQWCYVFDSKLVYDGEETGTHREIWKRCASCISAENGESKPQHPNPVRYGGK